ncbi:MAG: hypothetical protein Q8N83_17635 [Ignavibacteria bacterium]|nr:hypothetical protein [Ignavibacteria bacterium]
MRFIIGVAILITIFLQESSGQILRTTLKQGEFEMGVAYKQFERKQLPGFVDGTMWSMGVIYTCYGVSNWLSTSIEGIVWPNSPTHADDQRELTTYSLGFGLNAKVYQIHDYQFLVDFLYSESFDFDQSSIGNNQQNKNLLIALRVAWPINVFNQPMIIWLGPSYAYDEYVGYPRRVRHLSKSIRNFGVSLGCDVLLFEHISVLPHIVFANFIQPRVGLGYRF